MEDGRIKDKQITALNWLYSNQNFNAYYQPKYARLNNKKLGGGGWCSANNEDYSGAFIEIDLLKNMKVTGIASQGRGIGTEFIDEYGVMYKRDHDATYREYKERGRWHIFTANNDTTTVFKNNFKSPIIARRVRIVPQGETFSIYCGRFEIYGCDWKKQKHQLLSYLLPLADKFAGQNTKDYTYDGATNTKLAFKAGGLGKLTDDEYGSNAFATLSLSKWIAYKKRITFMPFFQFDFASKRRFSAVKFHMINRGSNIQVFSKVSILFSNDGTKFDRERIYLTTAAERHSSSDFIITVTLPNVIAKHLKCVFTQSAEWMLFSEVDFTTASPNAPLPTRPTEPTKGTKKESRVATKKEPGTKILTHDVRTTEKPTPRLFFSLPKDITDLVILNKQTKTTIKPKKRPKSPVKTDNNGVKGGSPDSSSQGKGSLSFPIIIAIVLGAVVISAIVAVLIFRKIRKMGKDDSQNERQRDKVINPAQSPEFHELLISDRQIQPPVLLKGKIVSESPTKLIMDSGYTSHGSAGGSVKDMPVRANNGSSV